MLMTERKPASAGEILTEEFMTPMGLPQAALAKAMGVQRKHVNELCNDRGMSRQRPRLSWRGCSATARISGSMCSGAMIFGKPCTAPVSAGASGAPGRLIKDAA
jgi:hypothetical protein